MRNFPCQRRGSVLIVAMLVLSALAGMVLVLARSMATEALASANQAAVAQAACVARGAEQFVLGVLATETGPGAMVLDESNFAAVPVGTGYFWLLRPESDDASEAVYGLVEESSPTPTASTPKLNLNDSANAGRRNALYEELIKLPALTEDIANSILDWVDIDEESTGSGAESSYYESLPEPYAAKNDRFETVEELLLVKGVTPQILYGDPNSTDTDLARGIFDKVTVYGAPTGGGSNAQPRPFYSADIVAVSGNGRAFRRTRIVVDLTTATAPKIVYRRDLTDRGWPLDPAWLTSLRTGGNASGSTGMSGGLGF